MRVLYHPKVGALFVDWFPADAPALRHARKAKAALGVNWRVVVIGRLRIMLVRATPHWLTSKAA